MLPPSQRTTGFAMQSFFIGVGAVVASMLPWMFSNWFGLEDNTTGVHDAVKYSFYIGAFMLFVTVMWTVFSTKEYPPSDIGEEKLRNRENRKIDNESLFKAKFNRTGIVFMSIAGILALAVFHWSLEKELYVLVFGFSLFGLTHLIASMYIRQGKSYLGLVNIVKDFNTMPKTMIQLAYVQFFSWFALFAMWIYTTSAITSHMYNMNISTDQFKALLHHTDNISPIIYERLKTNKETIIKEMSELNEESTSNKIHMNIKVVQFFLDKDGNIGLPSAISARLKEIKDEYNAGANWTGILFGIYSGVSALAALLIPILARLTSRKVTHFISLCCGALGLISFYFIQDSIWLIASMVGIGVAWASILSVPYAMLSGSLPSEKMGYYMGVFNFFIVIPQIIAGTVLGLMLTHLFNGQSIFILVAGGVSMFISALLSLRVSDKDEVVIVEKI
jgi:maltose/moltooligosaccharide transporter